MKIYVLIYSYTKCGDYQIWNEGVFSSKEKAEYVRDEEAKFEYKRVYGEESKNNEWQIYRDNYEIEEYDLDGKECP